MAVANPARRSFAAAAATLALALSGCAPGGGEGDPAASPSGAAGPRDAAKVPPKKPAVRLIGDGSTARTGPQPGLAEPERLAPGEKPPQFVVFSWDGAGEDSQKLFSHFRRVAKANDATMTFFLSGVYLLPESKRRTYKPPAHSPGSSDIGFNDTEGIRDTAAQVRGAWLEGHEIGTHFNGHFCGPDRGVGTWSVADWKSEISQAKSFVKTWKTNAGLRDAQPLPFDYDRELIGGRTPCLEGGKNLRTAAHELGFRYDSSGSGTQVWPKRTQGLWDAPLQSVPVPGRAFETLSMDYNFLVNQSGTTQGEKSKHRYWGNQMRDGLIAAHRRAYDGNRAPLIIGNHFESWNGGTYMRAVEETVESVCGKPDTRCVSFRELVDWLDAQDPKVLKKLQGLPVGQAPKGGWRKFLEQRPPSESAKSAKAAKAAKAAKSAKSAEPAERAESGKRAGQPKQAR